LESCGFANLGYEIDRYLEPGETVLIIADGYEQRKMPAEKMQICAFFCVYYGYPASSYEDINVEIVRNRCGRALAKNNKDEPNLLF
jgi:amidophosphoribosyltransferase